MGETFQDLDKLEFYIQNTPPIQKWVLSLFGMFAGYYLRVLTLGAAKMFRTMLNIQQGNFQNASQAARDMVEINNRPEIRHMYVYPLLLFLACLYLCLQCQK